MDLPRLMLITHRTSMQPDFASALECALLGGARWIQLREPQSTALQGLADTTIAQKLCAQFGAMLSINGAHGTECGPVHWPQRFLRETHQRALELNGYSVHDIESAKQAQQMGADYVVFGHVFSTLSHQEPPRGLEALNLVCAGVQIPVLAIGGVTIGNARLCLEAGAHGVAVMRSVWSGDVKANVRELLSVFDE